MAETDRQRQIYSVSELTSEIRALLEERFPLIWLTGEISNFRSPSSGHFYFTLRDDAAQISAVMFRGQNRRIGFTPEDGMRITGLGRISVYEPRGNYQLIFEYLEPRGVGSLQAAFEQLKARLTAEGLFDRKHKRPLPFLPRKISVVTSPTGAVIHDIMKVVGRRFPNIHIEVVPVRVQGDGAAREIANGIRLLNDRADTDLIIIARGGGSPEDLNPFNSESVARSVFASEIPVISGVGHETDFTIADFVADLRAPTPSAAAEMAVPLKADLAGKCATLSAALTRRFDACVANRRRHLENITKRLVHPRRRIEDLRLRLDDLTERLSRRSKGRVSHRREQLAWQAEKLQASSPRMLTRKLARKRDDLIRDLVLHMKTDLGGKRSQLREMNARLKALNPEAILARGYSITRTIPDGDIVMNAAAVSPGQELDVTLARGAVRCRVEGITDHGSKTDI
ncbi:exodeoxyribonuclease VII large subunit [Desulfonema ishimotonii]|uniref:Exodeoxyribonuclease 7 large subunit n=1 Tax=Desulfonema ishimotonii TaxID=45657 RepID=A0A401FUM0_9BACT|nr:exodeoxyribonuclease VII large subunit [Desulfonema ishimotonii]GBC60687.1 exodeoxyribonuclease VII large subunit [Desulfonema ishimotonii]